MAEKNKNSNVEPAQATEAPATEISQDSSGKVTITSKVNEIIELDFGRGKEKIVHPYGSTDIDSELLKHPVFEKHKKYFHTKGVK